MTVEEADVWVIIYAGTIGSPFQNEEDATERAQNIATVHGIRVEVAHITKVVHPGT